VAQEDLGASAWEPLPPRPLAHELIPACGEISIEVVALPELHAIRNEPDVHPHVADAVDAVRRMLAARPRRTTGP
jgi:hypothetical protein